jgi:hypothetical protein
MRARRAAAAVAAVLAGASGPRATAALRTGLVIGAPEFQCR